MNLIYTGDPRKWEDLSLVEQLEEIRKDCCTGPCGQCQSTLTRRDRIDRALKAAMTEVLKCNQ